MGGHTIINASQPGRVTYSVGCDDPDHPHPCKRCRVEIVMTSEDEHRLKFFADLLTDAHMRWMMAELLLLHEGEGDDDQDDA